MVNRRDEVAGFEANGRRERVLNLPQDLVDGLDQFFGQRSERHPSPAADQQLVVEHLTQARQCSAHSGLTEMDATAGIGHAALRQESVERHEQVQVHVGEIRWRRRSHPTSAGRQASYLGAGVSGL